jgi:hypothetical protein
MVEEYDVGLPLPYRNIAPSTIPSARSTLFVPPESKRSEHPESIRAGELSLTGSNAPRLAP